MLVRLLRGAYGPDVHGDAGRTVEVADARALQLIEDGVAAPVGSPPAARRSKAVKVSDEHR